MVPPWLVLLDAPLHIVVCRVVWDVGRLLSAYWDAIGCLQVAQRIDLRQGSKVVFSGQIRSCPFRCSTTMI